MPPSTRSAPSSTLGVGWLLEHISFLREPLDALLGNPDEINANVDQLKSAAAEMHTLAQEHRDDLRSVAEWTGQAADAYRDSLTKMAEELESLGKTLDGTAAVAGISGMLVTTLRGIVFGLISSVIAELIRDALIAAASAVCTFGGSIAAFCGVASARAAATASKIAGKISKLLEGFGRQGGRLGKLLEAMEKLTTGLDRFSTVGGLATGAYQAAKPYETQQPHGGVMATHHTSTPHHTPDVSLAHHEPSSPHPTEPRPAAGGGHGGGYALHTESLGTMEGHLGRTKDKVHAVGRTVSRRELRRPVDGPGRVHDDRHAQHHRLGGQGARHPRGQGGRGQPAPAPRRSASTTRPPRRTRRTR